MESFEFPGVWWIPADPDQTKYYGPLYFDPKNGGKLTLTTDEIKEDHPFFDITSRLCIPIVHGKMDGRKVTLTRCYQQFWSGQNRDNARDANTQTILIWTDTVFLGVHFESLIDIKFTWMSVSYTNLDQWLGKERFAIDNDGKPYMKPFERVLVAVRDDLKISFSRAPFKEIGTYQSPYSEVLVAEIATNESMPYMTRTTENWNNDDAFFSYIDRYLRDFLNLVTGEPNYPFNISAASPYDCKQLVKVFYRIPGYDEDASHRVEVSFTFAYQFIASKFAIYLRSWIEMSMALRPTLDLYFKQYYQSQIDVETQFSILIQSMEAFHRRKYGNSYLEPNDYQNLCEKISTEINKLVNTNFIQSWAKGEVDSKNVDALKQKLLNSVKYGNDYSLRKRLKSIREDVLQDNIYLVDALLENYSVFMHRAIETRNYLAHRLAERNPNVLHDSEYTEYVRKLRKLLRLCFLVEMGFTPEEIKHLSQRYPSNFP